MEVGLAFDSGYGVVVFHGGMTMDGRFHYDDTWIYTYTSNTWTEVNSISETTSSTTPIETPPPDSFLVIVIIVAIGAVGSFVVIVIVIVLRKQN